MPQSTELILERLDRLERENRRLRRAGIAALALLALLGILGAARATPDTLTAHELMLTDAAGNVRARLSAANTPFPYLTLYDTAGRPMLALNGGGSVPGLAISDESGRTRVRLGGLSPGLTFYDETDNTTVYLDGGGLGPRLLFYDSAGRIKVHLGGSGPSLDLIDGDRNEADIGVTDAPNPATGELQSTTAASIVMIANGDRHKILWRAPASP
jgi:hypothetical protein